MNVDVAWAVAVGASALIVTLALMSPGTIGWMVLTSLLVTSFGVFLGGILSDPDRSSRGH